MTSGYEQPQTTDLAFAMIADPHEPDSPEAHVENVMRGLEHAFSLPVPPMAVIDLGDSNKWHFRDKLLAKPWFRGVYLKVLGNHDGNVPYGAPPGTTPAEPFSECIAAMPEIFAGREYWSHDLRTFDDKPTHVRFIGLQTNLPYTCDNGSQAYPEVNPPGLWNAPNPDHTGLLDPSSPQRQFLAAALSDAPDWVAVFGHRGVRTARHADNRKNAVELHPLYDTMEAAGVSIFGTGDIHTASIVRMVGGLATYVALDGGYYLRQPQPEAVPPGSLRWVTEFSTFSSGMAHVAYFNINNDTAAMHIIETSDAAPSPVVVYTETLNRNGGVAGSLIEQ